MPQHHDNNATQRRQRLAAFRYQLSAAGFNSRKWLTRYSDVFNGIELQGKTILDIGAGVGWASFYAIASGARHATAIEPQVDGSRSDMNEQFFAIRSALGMKESVSLITKTIEYADIHDQFDLVVINNAINHIDESACEHLNIDLVARKTYTKIFEQLRDFIKPSGKLLITDCSNRNFFGDLGIRSPVAPTIEWPKHQPPKVWANLLKEVGLVDPKINWSPVVQFGRARRLFASRIPAYFLLSHFRLVMSQPPASDR